MGFLINVEININLISEYDYINLKLTVGVFIILEKLTEEIIHISTIPVTIKVIQVGEKKLSVSVFNQIPIDDAFFTKLSSDERVSCFIGWVERDTKYILYSLDGILLRFKINDELLNSSDWNYKRNQYQKKYKLKHKDFLLDIGNFLNNKNQIYIAI